MLDNFFKIAATFSNIVTPIGVIIGAIWAYKKFYRRNEGQWNANLKVNIEALNTKPEEHIVLVNILIENIGNKRITPTNNGLTLSLFRALPTEKEYCIINEWLEINEVNNDILLMYKNEGENYSQVWNLDSGATYTERIILKIKNKGLYKLKCKLHIVDKKMKNKENWLTEYIYFQI